MLSQLKLVIACACAFVSNSWAQVIKTDTGAYPLPPIPPMGVTTGSKVVDPTFGTTIMRLTDSTLGNECTVAYSNVDFFNADSTKMYVRCSPNSRAFIYTIDSASFTAGGPTALQAPPPGVFQYWSIWSGVQPNILFATSPTTLYSYDVSSRNWSVHTQASSVLGVGETFDWQWSRSADDRVFADSFQRNGTGAGYVVWRNEPSGAKTVLLKVNIAGVNEVQVDKSGRFLSVVMQAPDNSLWDLSTMPPTERKTSALFRHYDSGHGTLFTSFEPRTLGFRALAMPDAVLKMLPNNSWSYLNQQDHFSLRADNELWALGSRYRIGNAPATYPFCVNNVCAFDDEITQVATDGSGRVRRLAHHRSLMPAGGYPEAPMANISRDGQFIAFTSNWGNVTGRLDVYLLKIPPAPRPGVGRPFPTNLQLH